MEVARSEGGAYETNVAEKGTRDRIGAGWGWVKKSEVRRRIKVINADDSIITLALLELRLNWIPGF